jgi:hypothetical protein
VRPVSVDVGRSLRRALQVNASVGRASVVDDEDGHVE